MSESHRADDDRPPIWVGHVLQSVTDPKAVGDFYEQLGMRPVMRSDELEIFELRGGTHLIVQPDPEARPGTTPFDLMIDDVDGCHAAWTQAGLAPGEIRRGQIHDSFELTDPVGNVLTINSSHAIGPV